MCVKISIPLVNVLITLLKRGLEYLKAVYGGKWCDYQDFTYVLKKNFSAKYSGGQLLSTCGDKGRIMINLKSPGLHSKV